MKEPIKRYSDYSREELIKELKSYKEKHRSILKYNANREKYIANSKRNNAKKPKYLGMSVRNLGIAGINECSEFSKNRNNCEICNSINMLCIDHNHKTKKLRGVLCKKCNSALGFFNEDVEILKNAIKYLETK